MRREGQREDEKGGTEGQREDEKGQKDRERMRRDRRSERG